MSFNNDQVEYPLPDNNNNNRKSAELLPRYFRTDANKKFLGATLDQILQPGVAEKLNGFFGRKTARAFSKNDNYISDIESRRESYQLEPVTVIKDDLDNVIFYKDYNDYIGQIEAFKGNTSDHSLLNEQEYYAWNPNIDWDKFVNFREYYWLPTGPASVDVFGNSRDVTSTYTVTVEQQDDNVVYKFSPPGLTPNPTLKLYRGQTYRFEINCPEYPIAFSISRTFRPGDALLVNTSEGVSGPGLFDAKLYDAGNKGYDQGEYVVPPVQGGIEGFDPDKNVSTLYNDGVTKTELGVNDQSQSVLFVERGIIEFTVPENAPDALFYISDTDIDTSGLIKILDIVENSEINVEEEILGKKTYTTVSGFDLSNGMKVRFVGDVEPAQYEKSEYIVEGVGDSIKLIDVNDLIIPAAYTEDILVPFDTTRFDNLPYSNANSFAGKKDYIVINRASRDRNAWTRYNRWVHRDVIEKSAEINGFAFNIDQNLRAKRPIIEFEAGLKLYQFGTQAKQDVDLIDTFTKDVFSNIEGQQGYNVDGIDLIDGMRILFAADTDIRVRGKTYRVEFILFNNSRQIALREEPDLDPAENETVLVRQGLENRGKLWYFDGDSWLASQEKLDTNQPPLFDLFDSDGTSLGDNDKYDTSTFSGNKIFSYRENPNSPDVELGFGLTYRNIQNSGDILFDFNLLTETVSYQIEETAAEKTTDTSFLRKYTDKNSFEYVNGWTRAEFNSQQTVLRQYVAGPQFNNFEIDVYNNSAEINDLWLRVYLNNRLLTKDQDYSINSVGRNLVVHFASDLEDGDVVLIKTRSSLAKNSNGFYEFPYNLERNPLNENISEFTLGQVNDHVDSMIEDLADFRGSYPGNSNLRDLGNLDGFGKKFLQHSGPINLSLFHITDKTANLVKALKFARYEYGKFKRQFLQAALDSNFDGSIKEHVDFLLKELNRTKNNNTAFYFSDMVAYLAAKKAELVVEDPGNSFFALTEPFDLNQVNDRAVYVYLNGTQLINQKDYFFNDEGFCVVTAPKQNGDVIELYEYENTTGSFIPPTPTKLGLYPKFVPEIFVDNSYISEPVRVIQGHDGSITKAFEDYRDDLLLELELRIYNNLKQAYREEIFNVNDFVAGAYRNGIAKEDLDSSMISDFIQWLKTAGNPDYTTSEFFDQNNSLTFNYRGSTAPDGSANYGFWRAIYKHFYDTDRPHSHPWEMLGYTVKPTWWEQVYGPAPYTKDNLVLWEDLQNGVVREPNKTVRIRDKYKRPGLLNHIPVDAQGNLSGPLSSNFASNFQLSAGDESFRFGDSSPVETAWRRSSEYPFSLITAFVLNRPAKTIGTGFDLANIDRNLAGQLVLASSEKRITITDLKFPNTCDCPARSITSGLVNYIYDYLAGNTDPYFDYINRLRRIQNQLGFKLAGYTDKQKFQLILDSRTPSNEGNVFIPEENYEIVLNKSSTANLISYSGVVIEKTAAGFIIRGYDNNSPEFQYNQAIPSANDTVINVGGITESFFNWTAGETYVKGLYVKFSNNFYRTLETHTSVNTFDATKFAQVDNVPITGGAFAQKRTRFSKTVSVLPYGSLLSTIQEVVDFLYGYVHNLKTLGFKFEYYNNDSGLVENGELTVREFLFWTTQNWQPGTVITLSPGATQLIFERDYYTVDNIFDNFYDYSLLKADGEVLRQEFTRISRDTNRFTIRQRNTADGVFALRLPLVQTEHVVLIDNRTVFNDIVYDPAAGYRQERIKALGYRTADWNGSFNIPGFIYDSASVTEWTPFTDYKLGDTVRYKEFFYSANQKITGSSVFNANQWRRLDERPSPRLLTNLEYKINQFADFYDLDTDNFDVEQQKFAQHLIGYQNRKYLQNIINDDVSQYKFYQGFIQDKGTQNSLDKLFDALSSADKESLVFHEEWAVRESQYGASTGFTEIEYKLNENKFRLSPQPIELVQNLPQNPTDLIYRIVPSEVYVAPENYDHTPFPLDKSNSQFVKTAGFVDPEDVTASVLEKQDMRDLNINDFNLNDRIWVAKDQQSWNVYQFVNVDYDVVGVGTQLGNRTNVLVFDLDRSVEDDLVVGDFIAISGVENLNGFYEIEVIQGNKIAVARPEAAQGLVGATGLVKGVLKTVKTTSTEQFNIVAESYQAEDSMIWLEQTDINRVYKNQSVYNQSTLLTNPQEWDYNYDGYGTSLSASRNNTVLAIGSPNYQVNADIQGVVNVYTRGSDLNDWFLTQTINPPIDLFGDDTPSNFGTAVAVSPDGKYLAIGAPLASNVKTRFKNEFQTNQNYTKGDVVFYNNSLWTATIGIEAAADNTPYTTFDSYAFFAEETDSTEINLLVIGNYGLPLTDTDHLLVRAPIDMYNGTEPGDTVVFKWNSISSVHNNLDVNDPFQGVYAPINSQLLSRDGSGTTPYDVVGHEVLAKVDHILFVENFSVVPTVGGQVYTGSALGEVVYVNTKELDMVLYVKTLNGEFLETDNLFFNDLPVGVYRDDFYNSSEVIGGYWYISTPLYTTKSLNEPKWSDKGRGLVYRDVLNLRGPDGDANTNADLRDETDLNQYYNTRELIADIQFNNLNDQISFITHLAYTGIFDQSNVVAIPSDLWVVRAPSNFTGTFGNKKLISRTDFQQQPGSINEQDISEFGLYFPDYSTVDLTQSGFTSSLLNKNNHEVFDLWEGYIDIQFNQFPPFDEDGDGNIGDPIEPSVGDTIQDSVTNAQAEVAFYQRFFNTVRLYVKNVTGQWSAGSNFGASSNVVRIGTPNRTIGLVRGTSLVSNSDIGYLLVVKNNQDFDPTTHTATNSPDLINEEYWIYTEIDLLGIPRPASFPSSVNNDWRETRNLPANSLGSASTFTNEGFFAVYNRIGNSSFSLINVFTLPTRQSNSRLASNLRFAQRGNLTLLFVAEEGDSTTNNFGKIHIIKNGAEEGVEYDWELAIDKDFRGAFEVENLYPEGSIVVRNDTLYQALTNIPGGEAFDENDWIELDTNVSRLGYVPRTQELKLPNEVIFDPENGIKQFAKDFDTNDTGTILVTAAKLQGNDSTSTNVVVVYREINGNYVYSQHLNAPSLDNPGTGAAATATLAETGTVSYIDVTTAGTFESEPIAEIQGDGEGAFAEVALDSTGSISRIEVTEGGMGYTVAPTVRIETTDSSGIGAVATATVSGNAVTGIVVDNPGSGYNADTLEVYLDADPSDNITMRAQATAYVAYAVLDIRIVPLEPDPIPPPPDLDDENFDANTVIPEPAPEGFVLGGTGYSTATLVLSGATAPTPTVALPVIGFSVEDITVDDEGLGYLPEYTRVVIANNTAEFQGTGASATATIENGRVVDITVANGGSGFTSDPDVIIQDTRELANFGESISVSSDGKLIAVGESFNDEDSANQGKVYIYQQQGHEFVLHQDLTAPNGEVGEGFGHKVAFDGNQLAVSSINGDMKIAIVFDSGETTFDNEFTTVHKKQPDSGIVYLYERLHDSLVFADKIVYNELDTETPSRFGDSLTVSNNHIYVAMPQFTKGTELVKGTNATINSIRVSNANKFTVNQQITFVNHQDSAESISDAGLEEGQIYFVKQILNDNEFTISESREGEILPIVTNTVAQFRVQATTAAQGFVLGYRKPLNSFTWSIHKEEIPRVDLDKLNGAFLYNTRTNQLIENLDVIDPVQGKVAGIAEQELSYKTFYDPAFYNIIDGNEITSATEAWAERYVGKLWWDLNSVRFYNAYQSGVSFQTTYWNKTFPGSTVDVYEWVETTLTPEEWDTLSGTDSGDARGISGRTLYGNLQYSQKRTYDSVAQRFKNRYYYWVRNKTTVPDLEGRRISARQVAALIENPSQQGYRFAALLSNNRFALFNCNSLLEDSDVAINFRYWTIENQQQNIHNQYQIIADGLESSKPNRDIERKWVDSLVGYDEFGRPVPDPTLSEKQKYGTLFKPRQSWFKNRTEALKQLIERANSVLIQNVIVDDFDISRLSDFDPVPTEFSRLFDVSVDTYDELQFIGTANLIPASLTPVIQDGVIVDVIINNPGRGYRVIPTLEVDGQGEGAEIALQIDNLGKVSSATVVKGGKNYLGDTEITVRKFSALVQSDRLNKNRWVIYERNSEAAEWNRLLIQEYDVRPYWQYADWYAIGYNQFTQIDFEIDQSYQLALLEDQIGSVVKIRNIGSGGWLLLEKIDNQQTTDFSINYKTIGRQRGTIQLLDTLYDLNSNQTGFDATSFDSRRYDNLPTREVRIILETLRDSIFVDNLAREYNRLFFASLRYVFAEQNYVDWAFKTSFVQAIHNVGELEQRINFKNDNLSSYEEYVKEVKPFKTKIRQYVSAYEKLEPTSTAVTDFDLAPKVDVISGNIVTSKTIVNNSTLSNLSEDQNNYPDRFWKDNVGFTVTDVLIANPGRGYTQAPIITLEGGGAGATAVAYISSGRLTNIKVTNQGSGYISAPRVIINGSIAEGGESATASAILGNSAVRSTHVISKFDRVSGAFLIANLNETETFTGSGSTTEFKLKWPMDTRLNTVEVFVNGVESLRSEYVFRNVEDNSKSYTRQLGVIEFTSPPDSGSPIEIRYRRNVNMLDAQDRINLFYNPATGMIGNDIAQLMDGIDYGGVEVKALEFDAPFGWDTQPWYTGQWDIYDNTFEDEVFTFDDSTTQVILSKPLEEGAVYNVYLNGVRIDDPLYDGSTVTDNPNARMRSLAGDGVTETLFLDNLKLEPYDESGANTGPDLTIDSGTAQLIIRKSTSDGSFIPDPASYDTQLSGGNLSYTTATGINAEEIIVDGDGFVTPTTSKGPEELVPGQVVDTLDIRVYQRQSSGGSLIYSDAYVVDGVTDTFELQSTPSSSDAVFVRLNKSELSQEDYTIDYSNRTITLNSTPSLDSEVHIMTLSVSGDKILDIQEIVGDGSTTEFLTGVRYRSAVSFFININGNAAENVELINLNGSAVFRFAVAPSAGDRVLYGLFDSESQTFSQVKRDVFVGDGSTANFQLSQTPFAELPLSHKIIVKVDDLILNAGYNQLFTLTNQTVYQLQLFQKPSVNVVPEQVEAYLNGVKLEQNVNYLWSVANTTIELLNGIGESGDTLEVFVIDDGEYQFVNTELVLDSAPSEGSKIEIIQFSNHDPQDLSRFTYDVVNRTVLTPGTSEYLEYQTLTTGLIKLRNMALDAQYVWVIKNGVQLTPSVDYYVLENRQFLQLQTVDANDVIEIIHFSAESKSVPSFGFRQFKDMLNRTHFKRLNDTVRFELSKDLMWYDLRIELLDATDLPEPNKDKNIPGVIFINGERIEYLLKDGNSLRQLRRGTLGTGVPEVHPAGTKVENQSIEENIPYKDQQITQVFVANGNTNTFQLDFVPNGIDEFEVFAAGRRLRKTAITVFDHTVAMDSPEGDVEAPAEFLLEGSQLVLAETPSENQKIIVVRKQGLLWAPLGNSLSTADNDIARFLRAATVDLPE